MKLSAIVSCTCFLSAVLISTYAAPASTGLEVSASASTGSGNGGGGLGGLLQNIDLPGLLQGVNSLVKLVGVFCPPLSQVLDNVIQNVTSTAFRVFGRIILRSGGLGGGSGGSSGGGQKVNVVLPTFPPDEDYDDDEEDTSEQTSTTEPVTISLDQRSAIPYENQENDLPSPNSAININGNFAAASTIGSSPLLESESSNAIAKRHIRLPREAETAAEKTDAVEESDQEGAESAPSPDEEANIDDQDRLKRFLPFGGDGHDEDHGAGGGSGNFLFDIIRLVAGSGASEDSDEHEHGPGGVAEVDLQGHANGEGIPGPITRFFVIANRGLANVIQDLILRLAQTSERLVNFKARLITSLI